MFPAIVFSEFLVAWVLQSPDVILETDAQPLPLNNQLTSLSKQLSKLVLQLSCMSEVTLSTIDNGKIVSLKKGQMLVIRLDENPTTGYRWSTPTLNTQVLELKSDQFNQLGHGAIGGGGQRVFIFQANNVGQTKLQIQKRREWASEQSVIDQFEATIEVIE
jgi:inhibitor of cysteine peptidase